MALTLLLALSANLVSTFARVDVARDPGFHIDNHTYLDVYATAISRAHYNPWACIYLKEPGYRCLSCNSALHCYPSNFALLVQCAGMFPYCRNGYCSRYKTAGCVEDNKEPAHYTEHQSGPPQSTLPPYVSGSLTMNTNKTESANDTLSDDVDVNETAEEMPNTDIRSDELNDAVQVESQPVVIS